MQRVHRLRASRLCVLIALSICAFAVHARAAVVDLQPSTGTVTGVIVDATGAPMGVSGAISNFYYPPADRRGVRLTLQNTALGIAGGAIGHIAQEFLYARITARGHRRHDQ